MAAPAVTAFKGLAETALILSGVARAARWRHRRDAVVLAYHNVVPDGEEPAGDRSLHLPRSSFVAQLEQLGRTHEVVPLSALLSEDGGNSPKPMAAITFDDAYRGALDLGAEELTRRGFPATVFVAPGMLGDRSFWWDLLADPRTGVVPDSIRSVALEEYGGEHGAILNRWMPEAEGSTREMPACARSVTEEELRTALERHDFTVGSHTWSHVNLAGLPSERVEAELKQARDWIVDRFPGLSSWLSYPYGLVSEESVRAVGGFHEAAFVLSGGFVTTTQASADPWRIPRVNVPSGLGTKGFTLRTSGVIRR